MWAGYLGPTQPASGSTNVYSPGISLHHVYDKYVNQKRLRGHASLAARIGVLIQ